MLVSYVATRFIPYLSATNYRADAKASNDGSVRGMFYKKGAMTYAEAVQLWVQERDANNIVRFA